MEQRNLILAFALSMLVLLGWGALFPNQAPENVEQVQTEAPSPQSDGSAVPVTDAQPSNIESSTTEAVSTAIDQAPVAAAVEKSGQSFVIGNDLMKLTMDEHGWFTRAVMSNYRETIEPESANVSVLSMNQDGHSVYANAGVMDRRLAQTFALVSQNDHAVTARATLDDGHVWERTVSLENGSYVLDVTDRIINGSGMKMYRQVVEKNPDRKLNTFYEHAGPTGLLVNASEGAENGKLLEPDYEDLDEKAERMVSIGGWTAIMNRYFITALLANPDQDYPFYYKGDGRSYQAGLIDDGAVEGSDAVFHSRMYIGPKSLDILESAGNEMDRAVDFGWFSLLAHPMHTFLGWLYQYLGNYGWCIIVLVICIKIFFFYPTQKSYESMAAMRKLQPEMTRLKDLYADDRQKMGQETMKLYQKHKVNPLGGCLPILIQIPVFFALYKVLLMSIEMRQAPFIGWIEDMSVQDPYFVLPVIMGASMFIQQRLNPQPPDPMQAKVMQFLPAIFTVLFLFFPAGLVLYWVVNNVLSIIQQRLVMKRMNVD